jgi:AcrR family transcriptional regulator
VQSGSSTAGPTTIAPREYLNRARVLDTAVTLADEAGIEAVSMRKLAQKLGVVPMALYKHVANKDELLDGIVDVVVSEIAPPDPNLDWKRAIRARILSARAALLRHPWARQVMESKVTPTPVVLDYIESTIAILVVGGLSIDLTHHALHALGSRIFGFTQELYNDSQNTDPMPPEAVQLLAQTHPHSAAVVASRAHEGSSVVGSGCDDQFEFEFALDIMLDGLERLHRQGWSSSAGQTGAAPR